MQPLSHLQDMTQCRKLLCFSPQSCLLISRASGNTLFLNPCFLWIHCLGSHFLSPSLCDRSGEHTEFASEFIYGSGCEHNIGSVLPYSDYCRIRIVRRRPLRSWGSEMPNVFRKRLLFIRVWKNLVWAVGSAWMFALERKKHLIYSGRKVDLFY